MFVLLANVEEYERQVEKDNLCDMRRLVSPGFYVSTIVYLNDTLVEPQRKTSLGRWFH